MPAEAAATAERGSGPRARSHGRGGVRLGGQEDAPAAGRGAAQEGEGRRGGEPEAEAEPEAKAEAEASPSRG